MLGQLSDWYRRRPYFQIDKKLNLKGQNLRADELVKVLSLLKFKKSVSFTNTKAKKRIFYLAECIVKIKGVQGQLKAVVAKGSWDEYKPKNVHIFVTNHLSLNSQEVSFKYSMRWGIECMFRDLKDNLGFISIRHFLLKLFVDTGILLLLPTLSSSMLS
jgi:hypothetical protein